MQEIDLYVVTHSDLHLSRQWPGSDPRCAQERLPDRDFFFAEDCVASVLIAGLSLHCFTTFIVCW